MLEMMSFEVTLATSAREAIAEVVQADTGDPFQVVLMDWHMPEMDGLTAARIIRESKSLEQPPKVILITAYGKELARDQAEQAGLLGILGKPISNSSLFESIMNAFIEGAPEAHSQRSVEKGLSAVDFTGSRRGQG
jgi:CheY-like chemotaxis protein